LPPTHKDIEFQIVSSELVIDLIRGSDKSSENGTKLFAASRVMKKMAVLRGVMVRTNAKIRRARKYGW
jgi:hypothetical protein